MIQFDKKEVQATAILALLDGFAPRIERFRVADIKAVIDGRRA